MKPKNKTAVDSKAEYARIVEEASKEMITDPIKNIIDQYAAIADQNKEKFGKEYAAKYGCYKNGNYSDFRPSNSEKKEPSVA